MKRVLKSATVLGEVFLLQAFLRVPVFAQIVTPTQTPTPTPTRVATSSALPEAGAASFTWFFMLLGATLLATGIFLSLKKAQQIA